MPSTLQTLIAKVRVAEAELEAELDRRRAALDGWYERGRVVFSAEVLARHRAARRSLLTMLRSARLRDVATAPIIFSLILPIVLIDLWVTIYQRSCFPAYGIAPVRRRDFVVLDRHRLAYLNLLEKLFCLYCGYANGVIAYTREVASRTEAYWCPIKHARRWPGAHERYAGFIDYGVEEGFAEHWAESAKRVSEVSQDDG